MKKKNNYIPLLLSGASVAGLSINATVDAQKPNIVVFIADDLGTNELGCYGGQNQATKGHGAGTGSLTPNIDQLAAEGIRLNHNYASCAMSVPLRASMYTGLYPVTNGSFQNHKNTYPGTKSVTHYLTNLGYRVGRTGKDHPAGQPVIYAFDKIDGFPVQCTASKPAAATVGGIKTYMQGSSPFCLFVCSINSHSPWDAGDSKNFNPATVKLPPNCIDDAGTRSLFCDYLAEIQLLDEEVGKVRQALIDAGKLSNTIFIFLGEQGPSMPFGKWNLYNYGQHSAFIARGPGIATAPGGVVNNTALVQYEDILPTLIKAANGDPTVTLAGGKPLEGLSCWDVLTGTNPAGTREWAYGIHNSIPAANTPYPIRSINNKKYKLIKNLLHTAKYYIDGSMKPTNKNHVWNSWTKTVVSSPNVLCGDNYPTPGNHYQYQLTNKEIIDRNVTRPPIEFYDIEDDPWELNPLDINDPLYQGIVADMEARLDAWMTEQGDRGITMDVDDPEDPKWKGTSAPVAISTLTELKAIHNAMNGNYYLTNDIDIPTSPDWVPLGWNATAGNIVTFTGTLDGNGFSIRNLTIAAGGGNTFLGLFSRISGTVINLGLENVSISGGGVPTGALGGALMGGAVIEKVFVTGSISGTNNIGGLVGRSTGSSNSITNCYVNTNVTGTAAPTYTGGIVGNLFGGVLNIQNVYAAGSVTTGAGGTAYAGGILGGSNGGTGFNLSASAVALDAIAGGARNLFYNAGTASATMTNCNARNDLGIATAPTGGTISAPGIFKTESFYVNTLGWDFSNIWTIDESVGASYPYPTFTPMNEDVIDDEDAGIPISDYDELNTIVRGNLKGKYYLTQDIDCEGKGSWRPLGVPSGWDGADANSNLTNFTGTLDGMGRSIKNLTITGNNSGAYNFSGLFARIGAKTGSATVKNLGLEDVDISGCGVPTGALGGALFGGALVEKVFVTGTVSGTNNIGGLVGRNANAGTTNSIANCYVNASVEATGINNNAFAGSIVGHLFEGTLNIEKVYAAGSVTTPATGINNAYSGGILGTTGGPYTFNLDASAVVLDAISGRSGGKNLFYNIQTGTPIVSQTNSWARDDIGGTVAPAVFKTQTFYEDNLGWDFDDIWIINEAAGAPYPYPTFKIQEPPVQIPTSVKVAEEKSWNIFSSDLNIQVTAFEPLFLSVYDITGKALFANWIDNSVSIPVNQGIYILKLRSAGKDAVRKIIVK